MDRDIVYLDSKIWIELLKVRLEERKDDVGINAYEKLKEKVNQGEIICPISLVNVGEVQRYHDRDTKKEIFEMMIELSENHSITLYDVVNKAEIRNYIWMKRYGENIFDMRQKAVREGVVYMGGNYRFVAENRSISEQEREELHKAVKTEWATRKLFMNEEFLEKPELPEEAKPERWTDQLEEIRKENKGLGDSKKETRRILINDAFHEEIMPVIRETCSNLNINPLALFNRDTNYSFDMFYSQFPSFYTRINLTVERNFDWDRDIEGNDIWDIMSLAIAIPYCDIVASEEYFVGKTYASNLPEIYNTEVVHDLEGLKDVLN